MPDIYLYAGEPNPRDIVLSDPTVPRSGVVYFGRLKVWTGATWALKVLKVWTGAWTQKPLKRWDGSNWVLINSTGV